MKNIENKPSLATRLRDRIAGLSGDGGFTLLETLAVMVIVGLLAAITIPQLSKWREKSYVTALKSDAHNIGLAIEAIYVDNNVYPSAVAINASTGVVSFTASPATTDTLEANNNVSISGYTLKTPTNTTAASAAAADGFAFTLAHTKTSKTVVYNSVLGGIQ